MSANTQATIERRTQQRIEREKEFIEDAERAIMFGLGEYETVKYLGYTRPRTVENRLTKLHRPDLVRAIFSRPDTD